MNKKVTLCICIWLNYRSIIVIPADLGGNWLDPVDVIDRTIYCCSPTRFVPSLRPSTTNSCPSALW